MIVSAVKGGLGNMMFQIAAGISLAEDLKTDFSYTYDLWGSSTQYDISPYSSSIFKNLKKIKLANLGPGYRKYSEPSFEYTEIPRIDNLLLDGYFQSIKHFSSNISRVRELFLVDTLPEYSEYTFLHVRRQDYLKYADTHPICTIDYYKKALMSINPKNCIIVSDDIEWCKKNFLDNHFEFSQSNDPLLDISIMKSCKNAIISNSTFSWWGAVLNESSNKVIAPAKWFGPKGPQSWNDIYCEGWEII